jgi:hypothetical protein
MRCIKAPATGDAGRSTWVSGSILGWRFALPEIITFGMSAGRGVRSFAVFLALYFSRAFLPIDVPWKLYYRYLLDTYLHDFFEKDAVISLNYLDITGNG